MFCKQLSLIWGFNEDPNIYKVRSLIWYGTLGPTLKRNYEPKVDFLKKNKSGRLYFPVSTTKQE